MASVREIAERAGVSISTVSRVLNNDPAVSIETRDRVLSAANRSGYVPTIGRRITSFIGFLYAGPRTLANAFDSAVLEGVARGVDDLRLDVILLSLARDKRPDETYTQFFMRKGVRGVIIRTTADTREVCAEIAEEGFAHVVVSDRFESAAINYIDCDSMSESVRAVQYLVSLGHRRIGFAMHSIPDRDHLDRYEGYRQALLECGLEPDERLVFRHPSNRAAGATILEMATSMADPPTAFYFADPLPAVGAMHKAHELGLRIPSDLSILGFDDADLRFGVYPTLTAVCQDAAALGFQAATWLGRMLGGSAPKRLRKTLPTFFEINDSTGPPPGAGAGPATVRARGESEAGPEAEVPPSGNGEKRGQA